MEESEEIEMEVEGAARRPWGLMIAVVAAVGIVLWLLPGLEKPAQKKPLPTPASASEPGTQTAQPSAQPMQETAARPGERGRAIIARLGEEADAADQAYAEAQRLQQEGQYEDAYLLYFFAAKRGEAAAALALGVQADPADFDARHSALRQAAPGQAYKWYRMAADHGSEEAKRRLTALHAAMKKAAAAGDEKAARVMLEWQ